MKLPFLNFNTPNFKNSFFIPWKKYSFNRRLIVCRKASLSTNNYSTTKSRMFYLNPIIMSIINRIFYFIPDEFGYHINFNTFQLIIDFSAFFQLHFHVFFHFCLPFSGIFQYRFLAYSFFFLNK